jgi:hypothetical protein
VAQKTATTGTPRAHATCIGALSLATRSASRSITATSVAMSVRPARTTARSPLRARTSSASAASSGAPRTTQRAPGGHRGEAGGGPSLRPPDRPGREPDERAVAGREQRRRPCRRLDSDRDVQRRDTVRQRSERRDEREVPLDVVPTPVARNALVVKPGAATLAKADPARDAGGGQHDRRAQRPVRRDRDVEPLATQASRRAHEAPEATVGAALVVDEDLVDVGMAVDQRHRFGPDEDGETARRDPAPQGGEERRRQDDVAEEARLHDEHRGARLLTRDGGPHRSA